MLGDATTPAATRDAGRAGRGRVPRRVRDARPAGWPATRRPPTRWRCSSTCSTPEQREHAGRLLAELVAAGRLPHRHRLRRHAARHRRADRRRRAATPPTSCCCSGRCPSWLYPVTMGATTIWERWDTMLPDGSINPGEMTSFNHYALGAVADWLHRTVAGLAPRHPATAGCGCAPPRRRPHPRPRPPRHPLRPSRGELGTNGRPAHAGSSCPRTPRPPSTCPAIRTTPSSRSARGGMSSTAPTKGRRD